MNCHLYKLFNTAAILLLAGCADGDLDTRRGVQNFGPMTSDSSHHDSSSSDGGVAPNPMDATPIHLDAVVAELDAQIPRRDMGATGRDAAPPAMPDSDLPPDPGVNRGWIGGPCTRDQDCTYDEAFCLTDADGYPRGLCSLDCDRLCPDRDGMPVTFCVGDIVAGNGACLQRCDYDAFPGDGCRPGYHCETRQRFNEASLGRGVCVPGVEDFMPGGTCFDELNARGLNFEQRAPISDAVSGRPNLRCVINDTVRLGNPINGITFQYLDSEPSPMTMSCRLAVAIHSLAQLLAEYNVVAVGHIGTYNCRAIAGTDRISQHGLGLAIDLKWFRHADGHVSDVYDHWEHGVTRNFNSAEGEFLYAIAQEMHLRRIFNIVLTPEYNAGHDNHFHVDMTEGSHFIGTLGHAPTAAHCGNHPQ